MNIGVPKETVPGETRVALIPDALPPLIKAGFSVLVESGAGQGAYFQDAGYEKAGAKIVPEAAKLFAGANLVVKVQRPSDREIAMIGEGAALISFLYTSGNPELTKRLAERKITALAMELMPRITRAQSMDVLSSMATICGYKAVLLAADTLPRMCPMLTTAAGTIAPARVLIIGAGVAGLQAIATARRLGAVASAYDMRPASKEQVQSLGGRFVELAVEAKDAQDASGYAKAQDESFYQKQRELLGNVIAESDVVITAAVIPGKKSPVLVTKEMVARMSPGSVIVDLAAERGGNCELTRPDEIIVAHDVTIIGEYNLAGTVPYHASQMFARNITSFLLHMVKDGKLQLNLQDEIMRETLVTRDGEIVNARVREFFSMPALQAAPAGGGA